MVGFACWFYPARSAFHTWATDIFPLPQGVVEAPPRSGLARGVRQRVQRRRSEQNSHNEAIFALSSLAGIPASVSNSSRENSEGQTLALAHVKHCISECPPDACSSNEAFLALLRQDSLYVDAGSTTVAPFCYDKASVPKTQIQACSLTNQLSGDAKLDLGNFKNCMLLNSEEAAGRSLYSVSIFYFDPHLEGLSPEVSHVSSRHASKRYHCFFAEGLLCERPFLRDEKE